MSKNKSVIDELHHLLIQIDGKKTASVKLALSKTIPELRKVLLAQEVQLPSNVQFLDAQDYPVSVINEKSVNISDLVVATEHGKIIQLRTKEHTKTIDTQRSKIMTGKNIIIFITILYFSYYMSNEDNRKTLIHKQLCPLFIEFNFNVLYDKFNCSTGNNRPAPVIYINTTGYLTGQIKNNTNGTEILISTEKGVEKLNSTDHNQYYVGMIGDWTKNKAEYKKDYEWYNNMKSAWGHCPGQFNEKVEHSNNLIENTPESIKEFTESEFNGWPQNLTTRINLKRLQSALDSNDDKFDLGTNGKIASNMYLIAWRREKDNTILIHTYVTIFERTAGHDCHFVPEYWTGQRERINNAKKYYLLTKIESNPVYKEFLLRGPELK